MLSAVRRVPAVARVPWIPQLKSLSSSSTSLQVDARMDESSSVLRRSLQCSASAATQPRLVTSFKLRAAHRRHMDPAARALHSLSSLRLAGARQSIPSDADSPPGSEADTGAGRLPVQPQTAPGTIDVTIDGEAGQIKAADVHKPQAVKDVEEGSRPSIQHSVQDDWSLKHPIWKDQYVGRVAYTHLPPKDGVDKLAFYTIKAIRFNFDWMSGYTFGPLTEKKALTRIVFLETVAGVPGSVAGTLRHLASLRRMKRDGGWINSLLSEAENERMHLLTALKIRQPGPFMKAAVFVTQGIFFNFFWVSYLLSPRFCHRLVGYLEEEAVATYTRMLHSIDHGELKGWATMPAPVVAKKYWAMPEDATFKQVIEMIRADEAHHRDVNHTLGSLNQDDLNPFRNA